MLNRVIGFAVLALIVTSCNKTVEKLENDDQKAAYAIGLELSKDLNNFEKSLDSDEKYSQDDLISGMNSVFSSTKGISKTKFHGIQIATNIQAFLRENKMEDKIDINILLQGVKDRYDKKEFLMKESDIHAFMETYIKPLVEKAQNEKKEKEDKKRKEEGVINAKASKKFLDENKVKAGIKTTATGLQYEVIKEGDKITKVTANEIVSVKYKGTLIDGTEFDSTEKANAGNPVEFPVDGVIPGWQEGIKLMSKGAKYKFYIPSELAYGEQGGGPTIGANQVLIFEVELLDLKPNNTAKQEPQIQLNANGQPAIPDDAHQGHDH